jgi:hypothetical protein
VVAATRRLIEYARNGVLPNLATDRDAMQRAILVALFARALVLTESIVHVAESGFGREALMLNRPLFELMIDAHWTKLNPELAQQRFVQHARFTQHLQRETARRYPAELGQPPDVPGLPEEELKDLRALFGTYATNSWTGLALHKRVAAVASEFEDPDDERQLRFGREVLNALANAELHPSAWSLSRALRRLPAGKGIDRVQVRSEPESELVAVALRQTWWIFGGLLTVIVDDVGLAPDALRGIQAEGHARMQGGAARTDRGSAGSA